MLAEQVGRAGRTSFTRTSDSKNPAVVLAGAVPVKDVLLVLLLVLDVVEAPFCSKPRSISFPALSTSPSRF